MANSIEIRLTLDTAVLDRLVAHAPERVELALDKIAADIEAAATLSMGGTKTGVVYRLSKGVTHQASAPGEAPAIDTDELRSSWTVSKLRGARIVGYAAEYATHLEFGTIHMAARPFFLPALVKGSSGLIRGAAAVATDGTVLGSSGSR